MLSKQRKRSTTSEGEPITPRNEPISCKPMTKFRFPLDSTMSGFPREVGKWTVGNIYTNYPSDIDFLVNNVKRTVIPPLYDAKYMHFIRAHQGGNLEHNPQFRKQDWFFTRFFKKPRKEQLKSLTECKVPGLYVNTTFIPISTLSSVEMKQRLKHRYLAKTLIQHIKVSSNFMNHMDPKRLKSTQNFNAALKHILLLCKQNLLADRVHLELKICPFDPTVNPHLHNDQGQDQISELIDFVLLIKVYRKLMEVCNSQLEISLTLRYFYLKDQTIGLTKFIQKAGPQFRLLDICVLGVIDIDELNTAAGLLTAMTFGKNLDSFDFVITGLININYPACNDVMLELPTAKISSEDANKATDSVQLFRGIRNQIYTLYRTCHEQANYSRLRRIDLKLLNYSIWMEVEDSNRLIWAQILLKMKQTPTFELNCKTSQSPDQVIIVPDQMQILLKDPESSLYVFCKALELHIQTEKKTPISIVIRILSYDVIWETFAAMLFQTLFMSLSCKHELLNSNKYTQLAEALQLFDDDPKSAPEVVDRALNSLSEKWLTEDFSNSILHPIKPSRRYRSLLSAEDAVLPPDSLSLQIELKEITSDNLPFFFRSHMLIKDLFNTDLSRLIELHISFYFLEDDSIAAMPKHLVALLLQAPNLYTCDLSYDLVLIRHFLRNPTIHHCIIRTFLFCWRFFRLSTIDIRMDFTGLLDDDQEMDYRLDSFIQLNLFIWLEALQHSTHITPGVMTERKEFQLQCIAKKASFPVQPEILQALELAKRLNEDSLTCVDSYLTPRSLYFRKANRLRGRGA